MKLITHHFFSITTSGSACLTLSFAWWRCSWLTGEYRWALSDSCCSFILLSPTSSLVRKKVVAIGSKPTIKWNYLEVHWGTSNQALTFREALSSIQELVYIEEHVKNYQPQILALTGMPQARPALVDFAYLICKRNSMLVCGNVVQVR